MAANNYNLMNNMAVVQFVAIFLFAPTLARITAALVAQFVLLLATAPRHQGTGPRRGVKNARRWRQLFKLVSLAHFLGMGFFVLLLSALICPAR